MIEPKVFSDDRGYFLECYQRDRYREFGINDEFVQDNRSYSNSDVLRGFHYCFGRSQSQLIFVSSGQALVVIADIRINSPTFSEFWAVELSEGNNRQVYAAPGLASSFLVTGVHACVHYKTNRIYDPSIEGGVRWDDPDIGVNWPGSTPVLSQRDAEFPRLRDIARDNLPQFESFN